MPRNARVIVPEIPYHVTQRGSNRQNVFSTVGDRKLYLQLIRENQAHAGVRILAYCLMDNHIHFIAVPEREDSLAVLFGRANGRYAQAFNIRRGRCGHLWQARYHSCPMSPTHLEVGLRYVEANPCRAAMVTLPHQYRWSSAAPHLLGGKDQSGVLDMAYWERVGGAAAWAELHGTAVNSSDILELRKCTYAGRPYGSEEFVQQMEQRFQRKRRRAESKAQTAKLA
jgi:putative transposase